jgi:Flp pilus assembly protein TadG
MLRATPFRRPREWRLFLACKQGLAAVEFALLLPVMIALFFGIVEISDALSARADVVNVASTAADLVAQETTATAADMTNVFDAVGSIIYPYDPSTATITIYSIVDNGAPSGRVAWSCIKVGNSAATTGPDTPPDGSTGGEMIADSNLDSNGNPQYGGTGSVILATISYTYTSPTTQVITGPITMANSFYSKPRRVSQVAAPASCS